MTMLDIINNDFDADLLSFEKITQTESLSAPEKKILGSDFYSGIRSELVESRIQELDKKAELLKIPVRYGLFQQPFYYMQVLDLVHKATEEARHGRVFFQREVLPRIFNKESVLDIGIGDGSLTKLVTRKFAKITLS